MIVSVRVVLILCALAAAPSAEQPDVGKPGWEAATDLLTLETTWSKGGDPKYFHDALQLLINAVAMGRKDDAWQQTVLDIADGVITKASPTAFEFGQDAHPIRMCVADAATQLTLNMPPPTADGQWQEIRGRRMRLLMRARGSWVTMRNAFWDGKPIVEGFGIVTEDDAEKPVDHNRDISLQEDLVRFMKEYAPAIDKFVLTAYRNRPVDLREVNELLSIGGYTLAERSVMIRKVAEISRTSISEVMKKQLTVSAK